jgi:imidazolonepropionase-like amidohydrolase
MIRITADLMIPGRGQPVQNGCVIIDGRKIVYAGPESTAPPVPPGAGDTVRVSVALPGMWDCHAHFIGALTVDFQGTIDTPLEIAALRSVRDAQAALDAGFTSIRDACGVGIHLAQVIGEGALRGPHIHAAGAALSPTAGHADVARKPPLWVTDFAQHGGFLFPCDGTAECLKAVRLQVRAGAKIVKICASGGIMSESDSPLTQEFGPEELRTIVEEAERQDRWVMAHCEGLRGIQAALDAGVRSIEHGVYLDRDTAKRMADVGAILVPTRFTLQEMLSCGPDLGMPPWALEKLRAVVDRHRQAVQTAHEAGVTIAVGTDIWVSGSDSPLSWGKHGRELVHLVDLGLSPLEAIEAATATGPLTLGPQAPKTGRLAEGYDADVIAVAADPLKDISVLADPDQVYMVWKDGELVKHRTPPQA